MVCGSSGSSTNLGLKAQGNQRQGRHRHQRPDFAIRECFKDFEMEAQEQEYAVGCDADQCERGELEIYNWAKTKASARQC